MTPALGTPVAAARAAAVRRGIGPRPARPAGGEPAPAPPTPQWRWPVAILAAWTAYGLLSASQTRLFAAANNSQLSYSLVDLYAYTLGAAWLWAAMTGGIVWLARRFRVDRMHWARSLAVLTTVGVLVTIADVVYDAALMGWLIGKEGPLLVPQRLWASYLYQFDVNLFAFAIIVAATHALDYSRHLQEQRVSELRLQSALSRARLSALQLQLQPHFLFNTLNAISELVHEDPAKADAMVTSLSELLRMSIDTSTSAEMTVRREVQFLDAYLRIQRLRFEDRLDATIDVESAALGACVPSLVLQPLVENAIRHGISPRAGPGTVRVVARVRDDRLEITVRDDGIGIPEHAPVVEGVGLRNTRIRLEGLYAGDHEFELRRHPEGGTLVVLSIPYRHADESHEFRTFITV